MPLSFVPEPVRRAFRWYRRAFAAAFAGVAVFAGLTAITTSRGDTVVVVAAHPIAGGQRIVSTDLAELRLPSDAVPDGALTTPAEAIDRTAISPIPRRGVLAASSLVTGGSLVAAGRVALPVRVDENAPLDLLSVGDRIDLLGTGASGSLEVVVSDARVVALPTSGSSGMLSAAPGRVLLVDLSPSDATRVASAAAVSSLSFALR
ncbi:MAG: SAF domain-containing protein [Propionicimonas sp.]